MVKITIGTDYKTNATRLSTPTATIHSIRYHRIQEFWWELAVMKLISNRNGLGLLGLGLLVTSCLASADNREIELSGYKVWTDRNTAAVIGQFTGPSAESTVVRLAEFVTDIHSAEAFKLLSQSDYRHHSGKQGVESVFEAAPGLQLINRISPTTNLHLMDIEYVLTNTGNRGLDIKDGIKLRVGEGLSNLEDPGGGYGGWLYAVLDPFVADDQRALRVEADSDDPPQLLAPGQWLGWHNRYEVAAIRLQENTFSSGVTLSQSGGPANDSTELSVQFGALPTRLEPGQSITLHLQGILTQKDQQVLANAHIQLDRLLLMNLWDWFRWLCFGIWALLDLIFAGCGNWGLTIILLALVVRVFTIPVTRVSLKYQELALQQQTRMTPLIQEVKDRYKGIEQSEKLIELYETQRYDHLAPFKSMIGLFVQIPIFIALFNVLGEAHELRGVSFLWIGDLAKSDRLFHMGIELPYFGGYFNLLPFLMAAVTALSTWLSARYSGTARTQSVTLFGMAGLFFLLFYSFPSALVLYWMFSNFFQLVQQSLEHHFKTRVTE
jgi:YidC/Oxa1 family membrane protein insertase